MKSSISTRLFLWLALAVAAFCGIQLLCMIWLDVPQLMHGEETPEEVALLFGIGAGIVLLLLGALWFISRRIMHPIRAIARSAQSISEGALKKRVDGEFSTVEIEAMAQTLNRAFDRYHEVVQRLDKFSGTAAHQLRTPLASIRTLGEVCLQRERTPNEYRECIEDMLDTGRELAEVVDKLLMMARLDPSRVRQGFKNVMLDDLLCQVIERFRPRLDEKQIHLVLDVQKSIEISGDEELIGQAIVNLIDNAAKFVPQGGTVSILLKKQDRMVRLKICDNGPGIPANMRRCLEREQAGQWRGEWPAGRMGLAIASDIMRIHEGKLTILDGEQGGTYIELVWPPASFTL